MNTSVGIDVSARKFDAAALREGKKAAAKSFDNDPSGFALLISWLKSFEAPQVTMEATGVYHLDLAFALSDAQVPVAVVNPRQVKRFIEARARNVQTDKVDATELAEFGKRMDFVPWLAPTSGAMALHKLSRALGALTKLHTATANRAHAAAATAQTPKMIIQTLNKLLKFLDKQRDELTQEALFLVAKDALLQRQFTLLLSVKGIAETSALQILAELVVLPKELSAKAWVKYAGLDPSMKQSGTSVQSKTRISKRGNARLRAALYMPAMSARCHDMHLRAFAERLIANHKTPLQAIVAIQRKLLHGIHAMLKNNAPWNGSQLVNIQEKAA